MYISAQGQGEDRTFALSAHTPDDARRWTEALWEHILNMSEAMKNINPR